MSQNSTEPVSSFELITGILPKYPILGVSLVEIKYKELELVRLSSLFEDVFGYSADFTFLQNEKNLIILLATLEDQYVGFKIGYEVAPDLFYSWAGGVRKKYRNNGIASKLMCLQHDILLAKNFQVVETRCRPSWSAMVYLNYKYGLKLTKSYLGKSGDRKLLFKKVLTN